MASIRELKGRIGSVSSSEKITGAMKMISSAKLHKAMQALQRVVPFRQQIQSTIDHLLAADSEYISPLAQERPLQHVGIVLLGSDEGLCGAFNVTLFKHALDRIASLKEEGVTAITLYPIGKKVVSAAKKLRIEGVSVATTPYMSSKSTREEIEKMAGQLTDLFLDFRHRTATCSHSITTRVHRRKPRLGTSRPRAGNAIGQRQCQETPRRAPTRI